MMFCLINLPQVFQQKYSNKKVVGNAVKSGHFIPEQNPKETIKQLKSFFLKNVKNYS